jgi:hypothetical protein
MHPEVVNVKRCTLNSKALFYFALHPQAQLPPFPLWKGKAEVGAARSSIHTKQGLNLESHVLNAAHAHTRLVSVQRNLVKVAGCALRCPFTNLTT